ncbi:MAG: mandelate racemase/muconate lactonizing enzyme family protein [Rhodospirillaceae bacterium]|nr:mandelate racemase/muconate lactonizing enzyme family protein [Rhodospirillaceae bacterium]
MRIAKLETFPVRVPYKHDELSSIVARSGVSDVIVKLTTDCGLVGWGESCTAADTAGIESAIRSMAPFVVGRDPWETEAIARDVFISGGWQFQEMTGNFAFAGIDMALWDLCGKSCGQPLYRLFGGALRDEVDYFYYLHWGTPDEVARQGRDGIGRGYAVFYLKVGRDTALEEDMLAALREAIGPDARIRIDVNQAWTLPEAHRTLLRWHARFDLDFVEAPVPIDPVENMADLRQPGLPALCANEGLWREADAIRIVQSRSCDYLCASNYWVGSFRRFLALIHTADREGQLVCKHTHGELGITAAAGQHAMLCAPNACDGHQQTAQIMTDDILLERIPIADGPKWGRIDEPGLGVEVDEDKLMTYHEAYRRDGEFVPYSVVASE